MRVVAKVLFTFLIMIGVAGCQAAPEPAKPAAATAATAGPTTQPYGSLAQVMRSIPFPNSNIIFDAQTNDPGAAKKPEAGAGRGATGAAAA